MRRGAIASWWNPVSLTILFKAFESGGKADLPSRVAVRKCPVGVEHHLLRLARIGLDEQHAAVAEPDMGGLHDHRNAIQQNDFVAPVELIGEW
jgi:hypothetical protein